MSVCGGDFPTQHPQYKEARGTILSTPSAIFLSASAIVSGVVGHGENFDCSGKPRARFLRPPAGLRALIRTE